MRSPFLPQPTRFPDSPCGAPRSARRRLLFVAFLLLVATAVLWLSARPAASDAPAFLQQMTGAAG